MKLLLSVLILIMPFALSGPIEVARLLNVASCLADETLPAWYDSARRYIETDAQLVKVHNSSHMVQLNALSDREAAANRLKSFSIPSEQDITRLLKSDSVEQRGAALATAMLYNLGSISLAKAILENYLKEEDFFAKYYSQRILENVPDSKLRDVEERLFEILRNEKDEAIIVGGMKNVERLDRGKRIELFVQYMANGSEGLQRACAVSLVKVGSPDIDVVTSALKRRNATSALSYLDQVKAEAHVQ